MPNAPKKNAKQVNMELSADLVERAKAFAAGRGETFVQVVAVALERHMANPPPLPTDVPLPPVTAPAPVAAGKKGPARGRKPGAGKKAGG